MTLSTPQRLGILALLALVMAATRINHFAVTPDASWALFFIAGFYLRGSMRWAFPLLIAFAVLIDFLVISSQGMNFLSHYCMSPGYWFLLPSYALLWAGGSWLRKQYTGLGARALGLLAGSLVVAASACFVLSNGSFYWLTNMVASPSLEGWILNLGHWYVPYLSTTASYVAIAALGHTLGALIVRKPAQAPHQPASRG